ncbi:YoaK family protein [Motilimonas sp. 1_MG-2023]|uniref:YoaK family protein n=1 Tax=Motilimonas sp. 1_MG-2023 TaxID=3062672 RepID=UPI0026E362DE|nr:YoaK family protein [Motilimonas sp. 1_MG-2023]MDO6525207.1 YoaK family protein [Motilimonas sp. 1_MG-2023]
MITRLPKWIELGAFFLAVLAGCVNSIGLLGFEHQAVSHLSGSVTQFGVGLLSFSNGTFHLLLIILSFLGGAMISGVLIENTALKLGRHYGSALLIESVLLFLAMLALLDGSNSGHYFASAACGLQNALITTYSGAIVRTTHVTGVFTDLGLMLGAKLRGQPFDRRKGILFLIIIIGFTLGGLMGAILYPALHYLSLLVPAAMAFVLAVVYHIWVRS